MSDKESSWKFAEDFVVESEHISEARRHSVELGVEAITPAMGAQLAVVCAAMDAKSIIEVGTGVGISGLWMLSGAPGATITSIDLEAEHQNWARRAFLDAGVPAKSARFITGQALEVLPRMNESSYDIVFIDADAASVIEYVEHGLRLVRAGGAVLVAHALWRDAVADPVKRGDSVAGYRSLLREISASDAVISSLSPVGDGVLQLIKK